MKLPRLVRGLGLRRQRGQSLPDVEVTGVRHDSRTVEPGDLFVAVAGARHDGREFVAQAAGRGAVAVVASGPPPEAVPVPWLKAADPRAVLAPLSARTYGHPDREMQVVGVTGTNGKTTVVWLLEAVLTAAGLPAGKLGTLGYRFRDLDLGTGRTTPEASDLHRILRTMRDQGAEAVAMEVSSHALDLHRVDGIQFATAVFTNLSQDHLDFHGTMERYYEAKCRLFGQLVEGARAVVNVDDNWGTSLAAELPRSLTYGAAGADISVQEADLDERGIRATVDTPRGALRLTTRLRGRYNLENLLAVAGVGESLQLPHEAVQEGVAAIGPVPGRMEPVAAGQPFPVFIDYAHTPEALRAALIAVRELTGRKVILVFGAGGDRDRSKRPLMGQIAGELADLPIVTSDNPRREDPLAIIAGVEQGLKESGCTSYRLLPDRRDAIGRALSVAGTDWTVLVAGKGAETGQEIQDQILPFSDREEIVVALEERHGVANGG